MPTGQGKNMNHFGIAIGAIAGTVIGGALIPDRSVDKTEKPVGHARAASSAAAPDAPTAPPTEPAATAPETPAKIAQAPVAPAKPVERSTAKSSVQENRVTKPSNVAGSGK